MTTLVQKGAIMGFENAVFDTLDQSRERFKKLIPPMPAPIKLAVALRGATQHRNDNELRNGKTYSGRNCQIITATRTHKKTYFCFFAALESELDFLKVSKSDVCIRACGQG
jgi:hypothetical protein